MKRGVSDTEHNNGVTKKQRYTADNLSPQSTPNLFSQITQAFKYAFSWIFNTQENHDDSISTSQPPILSLPLDVLAIIMAHATPQGSAFPPNANSVCRQFQRATDTFRFIQCNKKTALNQLPVEENENRRSPQVESQEKEIKYLLENEANILAKTDNPVAVIGCFNSLKSAVSKTDNNTRGFLVRNEILNRLNTAIIEARIRKTQALISSILPCSDCYLTRLPGRIIKLPQYQKYWAALRNFHLKSNQLQSLPPEIWQLVALERLDLSNNQLQSLPSEIRQLVALQSLYLQDNRLQSLPPEIGLLVALQSLGLSNNQLQSLPPEIGQLASLQRLFLNNNQFQSLPDNLRENILRNNYNHPITKAQVLASQRKSSPSDGEEARSTPRPS